MKKKKKNKNTTRNIVRVSLLLFFSFLVSFIICRHNAKANDKILNQTVSDAFVFQSMLLAHSIDPNSPNEFTDISTLEDTNDTDSFVSDAAIKTGTSQYYIRVNYGANCVTIYTKDEQGNYTKPYKAMICSSGKSTPKSGTYKISYKYRWLSLYGGVYGQYSTRIVKNILFHSVPYYKQRADSLEYEEYDKLGTTASAGCIRLTVRDAKWIYDNITSGTYVEFYSDPSNPGPLGKPKAQKISGDIDNRNWDPTDPDVNNPWTGGSGIPSITYEPTYTNTKKAKSNDDEENEDNEKEEVPKSSIQKEEKTEIKVEEKSETKKDTTKDESTQKEKKNTAEQDTDTTQTKEDKKSESTEHNKVENQIEENTSNNTDKNQTENTDTKKEDDSKKNTNTENDDNSNSTSETTTTEPTQTETPSTESTSTEPASVESET